MPTLYMTYGLPACGKSTWAKEFVKLCNGKAKRVSKDDLRAMLDNAVWSKTNEKFVLHLRDFVITEALTAGFDVICDDTNLDPKHGQVLRQLAKDAKADFEIKDFSDVTLEECLARDQKRANWVGEKVIRDMYNRYLAPKAETVESVAYDPKLSDCYIFDLDGTLSKFNARGAFDWHKVDTDLPNQSVVDVYNSLHVKYPDRKFFIVSGRNTVCRDKSELWLVSFIRGWHNLFMRSQGDRRDDRVVKQEIYEREIKGKYNVLGVFDDRPKVCRDVWLKNGLPLFYVGNFTEF